jgi:hypothetical protein
MPEIPDYQTLMLPVLRIAAEPFFICRPMLPDQRGQVDARECSKPCVDITKG